MTTDSEPIVQVSGLRRVFSVPRVDGRGHEDLVAVAGSDFTVARGGSLGIVGESGSGKSTIARMLVGLTAPSAGSIVVAGHDRSRPARRAADRRRRGRELQIVFQDPYTALDPRYTVRRCIDEVLALHFRLSRAERDRQVAERLDQVGLDERQSRAHPRELSGGQRQRVAIACALAVDPQVLCLDEAVSALDVSIQAQILNLLSDVRASTGMTYIFISHDLAVIRQITEDVVVLQRGEIVERGSTEAVLDYPQHEFTRRLRASVPGATWSPPKTQAATEPGTSVVERGRVL